MLIVHLHAHGVSHCTLAFEHKWNVSTYARMQIQYIMCNSLCRMLSLTVRWATDRAGCFSGPFGCCLSCRWPVLELPPSGCGCYPALFADSPDCRGRWMCICACSRPRRTSWDSTCPATATRHIGDADDGSGPAGRLWLSTHKAVVRVARHAVVGSDGDVISSDLLKKQTNKIVRELRRVEHFVVLYVNCHRVKFQKGILLLEKGFFWGGAWGKEVFFVEMKYVENSFRKNLYKKKNVCN